MVLCLLVSLGEDAKSAAYNKGEFMTLEWP